MPQPRYRQVSIEDTPYYHCISRCVRRAFLCAYAIMSNHYHIVVRINAEEVKQWPDEEVASRWMQIFSGPLLMHQYLMNASLTETELQDVAGLFTTWRCVD